MLEKSKVQIQSLSSHGHDLHSPECVVATTEGTLFVSDKRGGVTEVAPDGRQTLITAKTNELRRTLSPNGIGVEQDGSFLIAHLTPDEGGVFQLRRDGTLIPLVREIEGEELPPTNYVNRDRLGRIWGTVSTRKRPRSLDYRRDAAEGFIFLKDHRGVRIVADGLGYTNECGVSPDGCWLYVNETFAKRLSRFQLAENGDLGPRETVAEFGTGDFPDGLGFDLDGGVWVTCIFSNRLIRVSVTGATEIWLDAADPEFVEWIDQAYRSDAMALAHMKADPRSPLKNISSVTFGGPAMNTLYLGSLQGSSVLSFTCPHQGCAR